MQPKKKKVYISGKYAHWDRVGRYTDDLRAHGHFITWDWTTEGARALGPRDAALHDLRGVSECDVLLIVLDCPSHPYRGTLCELGMALALGKPVVVCNLAATQFGDFPFLQHPLCWHTHSWDEARASLD